MGNSVSNSKDRHGDEMVDYGHLTPQGVYTGPQDWNHEIVANLIIDRKLAPFYRPLEDYDESWDDERILAARKELPGQQPGASPEAGAANSNGGSKFHHHKQVNKSGKEPFKPSEASVYKGAVECPICFLYYPPNINRSRCCDQEICTECFVQIKRTEPTATHLVSEPASCPYCVQENFGVTYEPPPWRTGLVREGSPVLASRPDMHKIPSGSSADSEGRRRKSLSADAPEVVTTDHIRPDWEAKLAAVRAAVARRANRRIIMRQVGDRLIPIGITSGRLVQQETAEGGEGAAGEGSGGSGRRRRRHQQGPDINHLLGSVGLGPLAGQDLEEIMVMEAMRLSLLEHQEQQRRQQAEQNANGGSANGNTDNTNASTDSTAPAPPTSTETSQTSLSPLDTSTSNPPSRPISIFQLNPAGHQRQPSNSSSTPTLAAALAAAQTASAFLNAQEEERVGGQPSQSSASSQTQTVAHETAAEESTPRGSRAATPDPVAGAAVVEPIREESIAESTSTDNNRIQNGNKDGTSAAVKTAVADAESEVPPASSSSSVSLLRSPPAEGSSSTSVDEDPSGSDEPVAVGYKPLPSSTEMLDPLLVPSSVGSGASKADEAREERLREEGCEGERV